MNTYDHIYQGVIRCPVVIEHVQQVGHVVLEGKVDKVRVVKYWAPAISLINYLQFYYGCCNFLSVLCIRLENNELTAFRFGML